MVRQQHHEVLCKLDLDVQNSRTLLLCSLGLLVKKVQPIQAERILDFLCTRLVLGKKEHDRETASIALKTVVNEMSGPDLTTLVVKQVVPKLLLGMQSKVRLRLPYTAYRFCQCFSHQLHGHRR